MDLNQSSIIVRIWTGTNGRPCQEVIWFSDGMLECVLPPGIGSGHSITVQVADQVTAPSNLKFDYERPQVLHVLPEHGPTHGHNQIAIRGRNFGAEVNKPWVTLGPWNCTDVTWISDTRITCLTPPGHGPNLTVRWLQN